MDIQVAKFLDIYDKENPEDLKIDIYDKKGQITDVYDSWPEIAQETDAQYIDSYGYSSS